MIDTNSKMLVQMFLTEQQEIVNAVKQGKKITEWGSGGSTLLWYTNLRPDQKLISIESDEFWAERVQTVIAEERAQGNDKNFEYAVYPMPDDGATFAPEHSYYEPYVNGPEGIWDSDVYLVDGRVRLWVARTIFQRAKNRNATVYCHDYAFNEGWYRPLLELYPRYEIIETQLDSDPTNPELRHYGLNALPKMLKLYLV